MPQGRRVSLRAVQPSDYEFLFAAELSDALGVRWRQRGLTPSPDSFFQSLWDGVLTQYLVTPTGSTVPVGLVSCYGANFRNQFAYFAVTSFESAGDEPDLAVMEGLVVFLNHLFENFHFRKLYADIMAFNLDQFGSISRFMQQEGRLIDHEYAFGRYWDRHLFALYFTDWQKADAERIKAYVGVEQSSLAERGSELIGHVG